ncbi:MAG: DUF4374 domain-containing protein [Bacteroidaceae bacterium]|nr:DUF4374 domain-containing protein [Bacteroidaceae bacterium]
MNNKLFKSGVLMLGFAALLSSCGDDDDETIVKDETETAKEQAAFFFTGTNSEGSANYISTVNSLSEGTSTVVGNGLETFTGTEWFTWKDKYLFRLQYNQGNSGGTSAYFLNSKGEIETSAYTYDIQRFTTYGVFGDYVITSAVAATDTKDEAGNAAYGITVTYLDPVNEETKNRDVIISENFLGTGEYVTFSGIVEAGGKLYSAVVPVGLSAYGNYTSNQKWVKKGNEDLLAGSDNAITLSATQYPDSCFVVVYDNEKMENPTIIRTDKMSYSCGRMRSQYYQCIWAAENGDVYVFSPNVTRAQTDDRLKSEHKSSVMRIKAGATEFDESYGVVDLETLADGLPLFRCWSMSGNYFLLQMYTAGFNNMGTGATALAVYNGGTKELTMISGLPERDVISAFSKRPYNDENGLTYITVQTNDGNKPAVYSIDPATATATRGLEVECGQINYAGKLIMQNK